MTSPKSSIDPVGAAMTRDEIAADLRKVLSEDLIVELAFRGYQVVKPNSAPPVQAITEEMVEAALSTCKRWDAQTPWQRDCDPRAMMKYALEAAFRLYPAPSDDAQSLATALEPLALLGGPDDLQAYHDLDDDVVVFRHPIQDIPGCHIDCITAGDVRRARETLCKYRGEPVSMMHFRRHQNDQPEAAPSTLAEFREACARLVENTFEYAKVYEDDGGANIAAAIRALPIPETWRPIETAPKDGSWVQGIQKNFGDSWMVPRSVRFCSFGYWTDDPGLDPHRRPYQPTHWMHLPIPPAKEPK